MLLVDKFESESVRHNDHFRPQFSPNEISSSSITYMYILPLSATFRIPFFMNIQ